MITPKSLQQSLTDYYADATAEGQIPPALLNSFSVSNGYMALVTQDRAYHLVFFDATGQVVGEAALLFRLDPNARVATERIARVLRALVLQ